MPDKKLKILIVDDHELMRKGLIDILKIDYDRSIIREAGDGIDAIKKALSFRPDVILMDILLPKLDGIAATKKIHRKLPEAKILFLTSLDNRDYILQAMKIGAHGYIRKELGVSFLLSSISQALSSKEFVCPTLNTEELKALSEKAQERDFQITEREREILKYVSEGYTSKEIGSLLNLSDKTVDNHKRNMKQKLGVHSTALLVKAALSKGIIDLSN